DWFCYAHVKLLTRRLVCMSGRRCCRAYSPRRAFSEKGARPFNGIDVSRTGVPATIGADRHPGPREDFECSERGKMEPLGSFAKRHPSRMLVRFHRLLQMTRSNLHNDN